MDSTSFVVAIICIKLKSKKIAMAVCHNANVEFTRNYVNMNLNYTYFSCVCVYARALFQVCAHSGLSLHLCHCCYWCRCRCSAHTLHRISMRVILWYTLYIIAIEMYFSFMIFFLLCCCFFGKRRRKMKKIDFTIYGRLNMGASNNW